MMRNSIVTIFMAAIAGGTLALTGCGNEVFQEEERELQTQENDMPTGDGTSCSWSGTMLQMSDPCAETPMPSGYGPYEIGEQFDSPDGCNECECTDKGIMCTVRDCATEAEPNDKSSADDASDAAPERIAPPDDSECVVACTKDAKVCPDGSSVGRIGPACEFAPCPDEGHVCTDDARECPDGSWVGRSGPDCEFVCPEPVLCTADVKMCADGSYVSRSGPDCAFAPCPFNACEDKGCGDSCSFCPPSDSDCVEDAALNFCDARGECTHQEPVCR